MTVLAAETEYTLPADKQANNSVIQAKNKKNTRVQDFSNGDGRLIIPETLGLDVQSDYNESDSDDDALSLILHASSQTDGNLDVETNDMITGDLKMTVCSNIQNVPSEIKTPIMSQSRTEITPSSLSPGIFDEVHKLRSDSSTPKSARPFISGESYLKGASSDNQNLPRGMSEKSVVISSPGTASNQRLLRQATLSQSFKRNNSLGTEERSWEYDDEVQLSKAIRASLEEPLVSQSKTVGKSGFKVPLSPEQSKSLPSPRQKNLNEKENNITSGSKSSPGSAKPVQETRRSPRLSKLVKTHSDPLMAKQMDSARKNLFREASSCQKKTSRELNKEKSVDHTSQREKQELATVQNQFEDSAHVSEKFVFGSTTSNESQRSQRDRKNTVSKKMERKESQTKSSHHDQKKPLNQSCGLNGSLNPDVQLSMYLQSQVCYFNK